MKRRLCRILCFVLCGIFLSTTTPVFAMAAPQNNKNINRVVKSRLRDKNGNVKTEYYDLNTLPESSYTTFSSKPVLNTQFSGIQGFSSISSLLTTSTAPVYSSSLTGAYDDYTQAMAVADSTQWIKKIYVSMVTYLVGGYYCGTIVEQNPDGYDTCNQTAFMEVPANPFNYKFGSANSEHMYMCTGYQTVYHTLTWNR